MQLKHKDNGDLVSMSINIIPHTQFIFHDDEDKVTIVTPDRRVYQTTHDTMNNVGITKSIALPINCFAVTALLNYARNNVVPELCNLMLLWAVDLCNELRSIEDPKYITINIGGCRFCMQESFLINNFAYFEARILRWERNEEIFVDRCSDRFSWMIDYITDLFDEKKPFLSSNKKDELLFYGFKFEFGPKKEQQLLMPIYDAKLFQETSQCFKDNVKKEDFISTEIAWESILNRLRVRYDEVKMGEFQDNIIYMCTEKGLKDHQRINLTKRIVELGFTIVDWQNNFLRIKF